MIKELIANIKISRFLKKKFIKNNINKSKKKILVEYAQMPTCYIPFGYFSNILAKKNNAEIIYYEVNFQNFKKSILSNIKRFFFGYHLVYKSFGSVGYFKPSLKIINKKEEDAINIILNKIKTKKNVLNLTIKKIPIGEFIYDFYLRNYNKITIDIHCDEFREYLKKSIKLFFFWYKYLNPEIVKGVIISHSVYLMGLVGAIASYRGISTYRVSSSSTFLLSKNKPKDFLDFSNYPKLYKKIPRKIIFPIKKEIKSKIKKYFIGNNKGFYKKNYSKKKNFNILISAHCFTDAVHFHGKNKNCFIDFYEWIDFLGNMSNKFDYNWYIKLHPSFYNTNEYFINHFIKKYPRLQLLKKDFKNYKLLKFIDIVLTIYGSVGREFPLFGIPVINASKCGPHHAYDFNYHFDNKKKYFLAIKNIKNYIKRISSRKKNDILNYFLVRYYLDFSFYGNANDIFNMNEKLRQLKMNFYEASNYILNNFKNRNHQDIYDNVEKYIDSKNYRFLADNSKKYSKFLNIKN